MRLIARAAGVVVLATAAAAVAAPRAHAATVVDLSDFTITIKSNHRAPIVGGEAGDPGRTTGYWGRFDGDRRGSYRATCSWLADDGPGGDTSRRDSRLLCTILFSFDAGVPGDLGANGGSLVAQGLMRRPLDKDGLFTREPRRKPTLPRRTLPITGASGYFRGQQGVIRVSAVGKVRIDFGATSA